MNRFCMIAMLSALGLGACKKEVDPSAFDAGVSAPPAVAVAPGADTIPAAPVDSVAPLAPLASGAAVPAAARPAAKPKPKNFPECDQARKWCNHPAAATDKAIQNLCTTNKQTCFSKGGVL